MLFWDISVECAQGTLTDDLNSLRTGLGARLVRSVAKDPATSTARVSGEGP